MQAGSGTDRLLLQTVNDVLRAHETRDALATASLADLNSYTKRFARLAGPGSGEIDLPALLHHFDSELLTGTALQRILEHVGVAGVAHVTRGQFLAVAHLVCTVLQQVQQALFEGEASDGSLASPTPAAKHASPATSQHSCIARRRTASGPGANWSIRAERGAARGARRTHHPTVAELLSQAGAEEGSQAPSCSASDEGSRSAWQAFSGSLEEVSSASLDWECGYHIRGGLSRESGWRLFQRSGIGAEDFLAAWTLAAGGNSGPLARQEFCLLVHLLHSIQRGFNLPSSLGPEEAHRLLGRMLTPGGSSTHLRLDLDRLRIALHTEGAAQPASSRQTSPGALTTARTEAVSTGFATARGPEATSFLQGHHDRLEVGLRVARFTYRKDLDRPFVTMSVRDGAGRLVEMPQDSCPGRYSRMADSVVFRQSMCLGTPLSQLPPGSSIFFELRHWKGKEHRFSTLAWTAVPLERVLDAGPAATRVREGDLKLPLFKKPLDVSLQRMRRLGGRADFQLACVGLQDETPATAGTLSDLGLPHACREVVDKAEVSVLSEIEQSILQIAVSILEGAGFQYAIPNRSKGNQLYVPELDRIVLKSSTSQRAFASTATCRKAAITTRILQLVHELCTKRIHVTKRDLFYTDVKLFEDQGHSDAVLDDVACLLGCTRSSLNVIASEKGVVVGRLTFREDGDVIDCSRMGVGGKAIPPNVDKVTAIQSDAKFILLVEKDAAFMRLAEDRFYNTYPCIIITAKGQPDVATRLFLRKLKLDLKIPVLALVDADPYGLKILAVYMKGSMNMSYDSSNLTTPDIKWLGVRPSDLDRFSIPEQCRLPMTEEDIKTGRKLLEEDFVKANPDWVRELQLMQTSKVKAEIQALSSFGFQYLTHQYLPLKLQEGDWI
ncbi:hypothetical protein APUTEX25_002065 [Auxenochlorella protothecoides]|uniref:DNA topoisomerase 6 subunit A n=1 Tax=Auxenochlorella protothecoides TaxID=3075 RepID=A0A3M7KX86_AUXPR|nr:hypothetical protein APUTEX25_002065 [Auxenochlorella protothecoides]|eukprot:RMZ54489.1 hypothetical protein APUTEX25_002065 [Auxenochlorella protothecoides]